MRETFTQKRKSLLVMISMLFLAVIGGKAYAEVADNEVTDGISVSITPTEGEVESLKDFVITFDGCNAAEWTFANVQFSMVTETGSGPFVAANPTARFDMVELVILTLRTSAAALSALVRP